MNLNVVITGTGKGLGFAIAQQHLNAGDCVFALEYSMTDQLQTLREKYPEQLQLFGCDISDDAAVQGVFTDIRALIRRIDILYNVAGLYFFSEKEASINEMNFDLARKLYDVNALGILRVLAGAKSLLAEGSVVINITSEAASMSDCSRTSEYAYCMSKAAANRGSVIFAHAMQETGVRVFCVHPGWLKTDMGGDGALLSADALTPEEAALRIIKIAANAQQIPQEIIYLDSDQQPLRW